MMPTWGDPFDQAVYETGPAAVFTLDAEGELRLNAERTRDGWMRNTPPPGRVIAHFLLRDRATGWVQYVLATHPCLVVGHPRADVAEFPEQAAALDALAALGPVPLHTDHWPA